MFPVFHINKSPGRKVHRRLRKLTDKNNSSRPGFRPWLIGIIKYLLVIAVIYFAGRKLIDNWNEVITYRWSLDPLLLAASVVAHLVTLLLMAKVWCLLIAGFGYPVRMAHAFKISYIANLGRYIPGKIWPVFGMLYLARKIKINEEAAVASWGLAQMFTIPASLMVGLLAVIIHPELLSADVSTALTGSVYAAAAVIFGLSILMVLVPDKTMYLFNLMLRLFRRPQVTFRVSVKTALTVYAGYILCWILFGFSFWLFLNAVIEQPSIPVIAGIGAFVIAYQVGYLVIFAPGGLGVRELILTGVLAAWLGPAAAGIAVAGRLWNMVSEIVAALIALKIRMTGSQDSADSI